MRTANMGDHQRPGDERLEIAQEPNQHFFDEKDRIERLSRIRELVFGSPDVLLVPLGVVSAVAGGTASSKAVIIAGLAEAFAGALSMGAGEFISGRSEAQVHQTEVRKEEAEIQDHPAYELREMAALLEHEGIASNDATRIANTLVRYPRAYECTVVAVGTVSAAGGYLLGTIVPRLFGY